MGPIDDAATMRACDRWWSTSADLDPISLEEIRLLPVAPFQLGTSLFNGELLASYLLATSNFQNPLTRDPMTRDDCARLDAHLKSVRAGKASSVLHAYDLLHAASSAVRGQRDQNEALRREAVALFQTLFDFSQARLARQARQSSPQSGNNSGIATTNQPLPSWEDPSAFPTLPTLPSRSTASLPKPLPAPKKRGGGNAGPGSRASAVQQQPPPLWQVGAIVEAGCVLLGDDVRLEWRMPACDSVVVMSTLVAVDLEGAASSETVLAVTPGSQWTVAGAWMAQATGLVEFKVRFEGLREGALGESQSLFVRTVKPPVDEPERCQGGDHANETVRDRLPPRASAVFDDARHAIAALAKESGLDDDNDAAPQPPTTEERIAEFPEPPVAAAAVVTARAPRRYWVAALACALLALAAARWLVTR